MEESSSEVPSDCSWILDLLWGEGAGGTWAPAGRLPAGWRKAETLTVLPAGRGRSFAITLAPGNAAARALSSYGALRSPRQRIARRIAGLALATSAGAHSPFQRIDIGSRDRPGDQGGDGPIGDHLARLLGVGRVLIAFGGGRGPYRKPVLQVFDEAGRPLAYVKVAWNEWCRQAGASEAAALRAVADSGSGSGGGGEGELSAPQLISETSWNELGLLVVEPLPPDVRGVRLGQPLPPARWLRQIMALGPGGEAELAASDWWSRLRLRIEAAEVPARPRLQAVADSIEKIYGSTVLQFGAWHGDLVPWNLAAIGDRLYAFDWESSAMEAPVGLDALHYYFQIAFVEGGEPVGEAADLARELARPALIELGAGRHSSLLSLCHLLELAVRHELARVSSGDIDRRLFPAVLRTLETLAPAPASRGDADGVESGLTLRRSA